VKSQACRGAIAASLIVGALVAAAGCGKRGNPLPPLRPVPARIADLSAVRTASRVTLHFTVPAANVDGTTPAAVERVDVYRIVLAAGMPPPPVSVLTAMPKYLLTHLSVRRPPPEPKPKSSEGAPSASPAPPTPPASAAPADTRPLPGDAVTIVDEIDDAARANGGVRHYIAIPVAGTGRGRPGAATPALAVPLGPLPAAPADLALTYDEKQLTAAWHAAVAGDVFSVLQTPGPAFDAATAKALTPEPIAATQFTLPLTFGAQTCVAVRATHMTGAVRAEGAPAAPVCVTPVDTFPPPAPTGLQAVQEGAAVTLIWNRVEVPDVAGYIVLRGEGTGGTLQPLMRTPISDVTYRDTAVQPGQTYTYAVYAVDTAPAANVSSLSDRQTLVIR
jgi:hypothetical protein